jgi:hypothetical protein
MIRKDLWCQATIATTDNLISLGHKDLAYGIREAVFGIPAFKAFGSSGPPIRKVLKVDKKEGYEIRTELIDGEDYGGPDMEMESAYNPEGHYIGDPDTAKFICEKRGIKPELASPDNNVCSVGFCEAEQKWYGWSHRAMVGFEIGNKIFEERFGDDHTPFIEHGEKDITNMEEARLAAVNFASSVS